MNRNFFRPGTASCLRFLIVGIMMSLLPATSYGQVSNPQGELAPTEASDIWPQTLKGSHFNEFWTYHFFLEDDIKMHITFSAANFGSLKDPVTGVRISVFNFEDETYQISREYSLDRLIQDEDRFRFQVSEEREVWFEGALPEAHRVRVKTGKGGLSFDIDMDFSNIVEGAKWANGLYSIGNEPVGIYTHIPYAEVSGSVTINDTRKELSGTAYMDHTFQNETTTHLMHSGYRFISHQDPDNWDITYALLPEEREDMRVIGHRIMRENGEQTLRSAYQIMDMQRKRALGERFAHSMQLYFLELPVEEGGAHMATIQRTQDDERFSILSDLSWIARRAAKRFLGGEVIEFRGEAVLEEMGREPKPGYYNFFIVE
ncbi:MAG: hypothetical protein ACOC2C_06595 [Cyclonatronaceae bacterium]